ncbi:MAG TPA: hypothetical protein VGR21_07730 [Cryptosporangiaceae bacterium]|nr:hypothetical protein [Cryptosporangiaceae bacterium]
MQPVQVEPGPVREVTTAAEAWDHVVDSELGFVWEVAVGAGLGAEDAALVSQLTWLRLAQRWPSEYPGLAGTALGDAPSSELRGWLEQTVRVEAEALLGTVAPEREPDVNGLPNVVCLAPGFAPSEPRTRRL